MNINEELLKDVEKGIVKLEEEGNLGFDDILEILKRREEDRKTNTIPVSIFNNDSLSALESIVKYLRDDGGLNYKQIAGLLNRNYDSIAITYRNSKKKMPRQLDVSSDKRIPLEIFRNKNLSVLENLSSYLKDKLNRSYHEIAVLLNRDDRTIWTVYNRYLKKRKWE